MARDRVLKPDGRIIDTGRISAGTFVRNVLFHQGGKATRVGSVTEEIDLIDALGIPAIRRVTKMESKQLGDQRTLCVVESKGLRPLAYEAHLPTLDVSARYQDGRVTGVRKEKNHTQIGSGLEIPGDVFDIGSLELVLRAVEFSEGWSGIFNVADPIGGRVTRGRLEVTGEQKLDRTDCWVVRSTIDKASVDYRVAKDGSAILSQSFSPRKGVTVEFA